MEYAVNRTFLLLALATAAAACGNTDAKVPVVPTATIQRRDIIVTAEATGIIEPINIIEVKSKTASGQVMKMGVDIGTYVRPGDLIVQIDTTNITINYKQAQADLAAARSNFDVARAALTRQQSLFDQRILTRPDLETAQTTFANANASLQRNQQNVDLARQALSDAKVVATTAGTVITKPVSLGQVIQAGGTSVSGGTVIVTMADLTKVRARALVNETDIGMVQAGQQSQVTVDAFPDRPFRGVVEKIEPQATVQQNVTMFPVLVSLDNSDGRLRPGMNGEVQILTDERLGAIAVPNDAIRSTREARQAAALLGLSPDSVQAQLRAAMGGGAGGAGGRGGMGGRGGASQAGPGGPGGATQQARGELAFPLQGGGDQPPSGGFGGMAGGRGQLPAVTDADCKKVDDALKKKPAVARKLDDFSAKMRDQNADRPTLRAESEAAYKELGLDPQMARACRFRNGGGRGGQAGATGAARGGTSTSAFPASRNSSGMGAQGGQGASGGRRQTRTGLVFVQKGTTWEPRVVHLGVANYDYTEVLDGLAEGDKVAMLSAAALQAKRQEMVDRMKSMTSGPLGGGGRGGRGN